MKCYWPFLVLGWLLTSVRAWKLRGAAEKALYWFAYLQEDVYGSETSRMKVAPGCEGSRKGLLGQSGRCTFPEFLDYIWESTRGDSRPIIARVAWPDAVKAPDSVTTGQIINAIAKARFIDGKKVAGYGFHGNCDWERLLPGTDSYNEGVSRFGQTSVSASWEMEKQYSEGDLTADQQKTLLAWFNEARTALDVIIALREKEKWEYLKKEGGLEDTLGMAPVWTPKSIELAGTTYSWQVLDVRETIEKLDGDTTAFYDAFKALSRGSFGGYHAAWWAAKYSRSCYDDCPMCNGN